jgi:hypothetical protein
MNNGYDYEIVTENLNPTLGKKLLCGEGSNDGEVPWDGPD